MSLHDYQMRALLDESKDEQRRCAPPRGQHLLVSRSRTGRQEYVNPEDIPRGEARKGPARAGSRRENLDIHEMMKAEALAGPEENCNPHFEKNRPGPEDIYGISDQYIVLDSFQKLDSTTETGVLQWNFMVQGVTGDQVMGVRDRIENVIQVQMGMFSMPMLPEVPYTTAAAPVTIPSGRNQLILTRNNASPGGAAPRLDPLQYPSWALTGANTTVAPWVHNPYTQTPYYGHFTIEMREAGNQAYSDRNNVRHHFDYVLSSKGPGHNPNMLQAKPLCGDSWDTFTFTDPLKDIHGLTLVFRGPDSPIQLPPDTLTGVTFDAVGAAPNNYLAVTAIGHGLAMGDRIFIERFSSGNAVLDAYMNRAGGHVVAGNPAAPALAPGTLLSAAPAPGPYPDTFWLDPAVGIADLTPAPILPAMATVRIAKRRIRIPIRLRRVIPRLTQYISP